MAFELIPLPYDSEALAPAISAETLSFHHGKHHKAYIDKTNAAIAGTELEGADLETVIATARGANQGLFNNAAQSWNHGFYWHSLTPGATRPGGDLASKIDAAFGSLDALNTQLAERGAGHFASGWVWLAEKGGKLSIEETHGAQLELRRREPRARRDLEIPGAGLRRLSRAQRGDLGDLAGELLDRERVERVRELHADAVVAFPHHRRRPVLGARNLDQQLHAGVQRLRGRQLAPDGRKVGHGDGARLDGAEALDAAGHRDRVSRGLAGNGRGVLCHRTGVCNPRGEQGFPASPELAGKAVETELGMNT